MVRSHFAVNQSLVDSAPSSRVVRSAQRGLDMTLLTIGYEASAIEDFIATLLQANVATLVDVRQLAMSRRKGFSKNALREALEDAKIGYVHLSGLGDPKEGRDAARAGNFDKFLKVYRAHMTTTHFCDDLSKALEIAEESRACLMCYERLEKECHRKLVADKISDILECDVQHLGVREGLAKHGSRNRPRARPDPSESVAACG